MYDGNNQSASINVLLTKIDLGHFTPLDSTSSQNPKLELALLETPIYLSLLINVFLLVYGCVNTHNFFTLKKLHK